MGRRAPRSLWFGRLGPRHFRLGAGPVEATGKGHGLQERLVAERDGWPAVHRRGADRDGQTTMISVLGVPLKGRRETHVRAGHAVTVGTHSRRRRTATRLRRLTRRIAGVRGPRHSL